MTPDPAIATVAATLRQIATWGLAFDGSTVDSTRQELYDLARLVEMLKEGDDMCCPMCEEITCDDGCPLETVRANPARR